MTEISGIQLLGLVLMMGLFILVFSIIEMNWNFKAMMDENKMEEEEKSKEAEIIPLRNIKYVQEEEVKYVQRIIVMHTEPTSPVMTKEAEPEEEFEFGQAQ
jgi:hypothetical protein